MGAINEVGERILPAVDSALARAGLQSGPALHLFAHLHEKLTRDDGGMAVFNIVLRYDALVGDPLLVQEVHRDRFLQKRITDVLLVGQDFLKRTGQPVIVARRCPDAVCGKLLPDLVVAFPAEVLAVDALHHLCLFRVDDQVPVLVFIVAEEPVGAHLHLALLVTVLEPQPDVLGKALAFLLGQ